MHRQTWQQPAYPQIQEKYLHCLASSMLGFHILQDICLSVTNSHPCPYLPPQGGQ